MGADKDIIVALEFGTSAIRGIAGRRKADGTIQILDIEKENIANAIQRGVIYNIDKTTQAITTIVSRLNERLNMLVVRAYVGIGGQSLHTAGNVVSRNMETKVKITPEIVDNLKDNNLTTQYSKSRILEVVPQEYIVGNRTVTDPVGIQSEQIEARFMNVVAKNTLIENIQKCMRMANIEIVDMLISPLALADVLLTDSEKRSGCAMVDFGAGTTTVAIYNGNLLRHLTVIPLGGNNITDDIATGHQMESDEAETLKRKRGIAYVAAESDNPQMLPISNDRTISENDLLYIIGARQEEIIANVWSHIEPVSDKLLSGIVITGGAAQLKDMPEAIKHFTQFSKVKAAKSLITTAEVAAAVTTPQGISIDTLIALLMHGKENCVEEPKADTDTKTDEEEQNLSDNTATDLVEKINNDKTDKDDEDAKEKEPSEDIIKKEKEEEEKVSKPKVPKKPFSKRIGEMGEFLKKLFSEGND